MNRYTSILAAVTLLCSLATACRVGKDFTKPPATLPATYRHAVTANTNTNDSTGIGALSWKTFFKDPTLQTLIDSAIAKNLDLQTALQNVNAASLAARQARMGNLPELNVQVQANRNWPSKSSLNGSLSEQFIGTRYMDDYNLNAALSWEVIAWGRISRTKEAALATYLQTTEAAKAVQTRVVSEVAKGYYNLLMLDYQREIAVKNLALNDSTLRIMRLQYNAGQINNLAIEQAEAQKEVAAALIPKADQQIAMQENALRFLAGELPAAVSRTARLDQVQLDQNLQTGIPAAILTQRPDVYAAELAVKTANAKVGIARANMYPALNITASAGLNAFKASNWFNIPGALFETIGGSITAPIFQRGKLKTEWETSKIEWEKSILDFKKSVLTAVGEVSDALVQIDKVKAQQDITQRRVDKLQNATKNAGLLFQNGMANYLEVITAQSNVLQSELDLASLRRERLDAIITLYRSLGGGWK